MSGEASATGTRPTRHVRAVTRISIMVGRSPLGGMVGLLPQRGMSGHYS